MDNTVTHPVAGGANQASVGRVQALVGGSSQGDATSDVQLALSGSQALMNPMQFPPGGAVVSAHNAAMTPTGHAQTLGLPLPTTGATPSDGGLLTPILPSSAHVHSADVQIPTAASVVSFPLKFVANVLCTFAQRKKQILSLV